MDFSKYKILFFGSSEFAIPALRQLIKNRWQIVAVVTQPDRPKGRGGQLTPTPVKQLALRLKLPVLEFGALKGGQVFRTLKNFGADFAVVASYGLIIPKEFFAVVRLYFLNLHPSFLPRYRGPSPIQYALLNGEEKTGATVMVMDEKMDHGPTVAQQMVEILPDDDFASVHDRLAVLSAELLVKVLPDWIMGKIIVRPQDDRRATFTKILTREDGRIDWKKPAVAIVRQVRAFNPWPGSWTILEATRLKILSARQAETDQELTPGQIGIAGKKLLVGCGNQTTLEILRLQPEGKKEMSAESYLRGHRLAESSSFI